MESGKSVFVRGFAVGFLKMTCSVTLGAFVMIMLSELLGEIPGYMLGLVVKAVIFVAFTCLFMSIDIDERIGGFLFAPATIGIHFATRIILGILFPVLMLLSESSFVEYRSILRILITIVYPAGILNGILLGLLKIQKKGS